MSGARNFKYLPKKFGLSCFVSFVVKCVRYDEVGRCYTVPNSHLGRIIWIPTPVLVGFLVKKVALRRGFLRELRLSLVSNISRSLGLLDPSRWDRFCPETSVQN